MRRNYTGAYSRQRYSRFSTDGLGRRYYTLHAAPNDTRYGSVSRQPQPIHVEVKQAGSATQQQYSNYAATAQAALSTTAVKPELNKTATISGYAEGTRVTLTASPAQGYAFSHWKGAPSELEASANPLTLTMDADLDLTAVFVKQEQAETPEPAAPGSAGGAGIFETGAEAPAPSATSTVPATGTMQRACALARRYWWVIAIAAALYLGKEGRQ